MTEFLQINVRHQTADSGDSVNTKQDECHKNLHLSILFSNNRKSKMKKTSLKEGMSHNGPVGGQDTVAEISPLPQGLSILWFFACYP